MSHHMRVVNTFFSQQNVAEGGGGQSARVIADDRSNSIIVGGDTNARLRIKALIAHLDTPLDNGGDTQVVYLQFADAEKIATKLKEQISATVAITGAAPAAGAAGGSSVGASADRSTTIWAERGRQIPTRTSGPTPSLINRWASSLARLLSSAYESSLPSCTRAIRSGSRSTWTSNNS